MVVFKRPECPAYSHGKNQRVFIYNRVKRLKKSLSKNEKIKAKRLKEIKKKHKDYIEECNYYLKKSAQALKIIRTLTNKRERNRHSGIEFTINAVENHGLDKCPDRRLAGFKRYVSLAILSRNIQIIGKIIQQKELKKISIKKLVA